MTWRSCFYHHLSFTDKETEPQNDFKKQNKTTLSYILGMGTSDAELWAQFWHQGPFHNHPLLCLTSCLWAPCTIKLQWYQTTLNSVNTSNCFKPLRFCMESPHQTLPLHGNKNCVPLPWSKYLLLYPSITEFITMYHNYSSAFTFLHIGLLYLPYDN